MKIVFHAFITFFPPNLRMLSIPGAFPFFQAFERVFDLLVCELWYFLLLWAFFLPDRVVFLLFLRIAFYKKSEHILNTSSLSFVVSPCSLSMLVIFFFASLFAYFCWSFSFFQNCCYQFFSIPSFFFLSSWSLLFCLVLSILSFPLWSCFLSCVALFFSCRFPLSSYLLELFSFELVFPPFGLCYFLLL